MRKHVLRFVAFLLLTTGTAQAQTFNPAETGRNIAGDMAHGAANTASRSAGNVVRETVPFGDVFARHVENIPNYVGQSGDQIARNIAQDISNQAKQGAMDAARNTEAGQVWQESRIEAQRMGDIFNQNVYQPVADVSKWATATPEQRQAWFNDLGRQYQSQAEQMARRQFRPITDQYDQAKNMANSVIYTYGPVNAERVLRNGLTNPGSLTTGYGHNVTDTLSGFFPIDQYARTGSVNVRDLTLKLPGVSDLPGVSGVFTENIQSPVSIAGTMRGGGTAIGHQPSAAAQEALKQAKESVLGDLVSGQTRKAQLALAGQDPSCSPAIRAAMDQERNDSLNKLKGTLDNTQERPGSLTSLSCYDKIKELRKANLFYPEKAQKDAMLEDWAKNMCRKMDQAWLDQVKQDLSIDKLRQNFADYQSKFGAYKLGDLQKQLTPKLNIPTNIMK